MFSFNTGPLWHFHQVKTAAALKIGAEDDLSAVGGECGVHYAAQAAGQTVFALFVEVIHKEVVDLVAGGDKEQLVALGQPLRPQVVGGVRDDGA